jgi:hypothetical protein
MFLGRRLDVLVLNSFPHKRSQNSNFPTIFFEKVHWALEKGSVNFLDGE